MNQILALCMLTVVPADASDVTPPTTHERTQIQVTVDPRIELLAIVQILGNRRHEPYDMARYPTVYREDVTAYFSPYREHPAVKLYDRLAEGGFAYDAPPASMLYLSPPPKLDIELPLTDYLERRVGDEKSFTDFVRRLRFFAHQSRFMDFFRAHRGTYDRIIADTKRNVHLDDSALLEEYFGIRQRTYTIILAPLYHHGGYGMGIERAGGGYDIYSIQGPQGHKDGYPYFGSEAGLRKVTWHEFAHSFVNPATEMHLERVNELDALFRPIESRMANMAYPTWDICVNEHVVRAVCIRLTYRTDGGLAARAELLQEKMRGFVYIGPICEALERYEQQRETYPDFVTFYPEVIEVLAKQIETPTRPASQ